MIKIEKEDKLIKIIFYIPQFIKSILNYFNLVRKYRTRLREIREETDMSSRLAGVYKREVGELNEKLRHINNKRLCVYKYDDEIHFHEINLPCGYATEYVTYYTPHCEVTLRREQLIHKLDNTSYLQSDVYIDSKLDKELIKPESVEVYAFYLYSEKRSIITHERVD